VVFVNLLEPINVYCERTGHGLWDEPLNALTNWAFIFAALLVWPTVNELKKSEVLELRQSGRAAGKLAISLGLIGLFSGSFHTYATPLTGMLDVLSIAACVVLFVVMHTKWVLGWPTWVGVVAAILIVVLSVLLPGQVCARLLPEDAPSWLSRMLFICAYAPAMGGAALLGLLCL